MRCADCGQENPSHAKFCLGCGARLEAPEPAREIRKVVTIVFSDVMGSTDLGERLDPESLRRVMSRYFDEMRVALENHGGTVEKFIGDAVMAVFGIPTLHEDDALRAVRAAAEMGERLELLNESLRSEWGVELRIRTGVNTGEVVAGQGGGQTLVTGDAVNVAARLEQAAQPGQILIGEETLKLVRHAVEVDNAELLSLKGKELPVAGHPLRHLKKGADARRARLESPMLGRDRERTLLLHAFDRTFQENRCHLFTVLGSAGVGKSRLIGDVLSALEDRALVLEGRCLPYGDGNTFWPVQEIVKAAAGLDEKETPDEARRKVGALLGTQEGSGAVTRLLEQAIGLVDATASLEDIFWSIRRLLESLAKTQPLVVVFDDIHWGEAAFLDLIEHIADWSQDAPILLVCVARPDLLDTRSTWGGGKMNASAILLEPLGTDDATALIDNLLGGAGIDESARDQIIRGAEGNPLFVEEMIGMMVDEGLLVDVGGRWEPTRGLSNLIVPPTIQALLSARLDLLQPGPRRVIEAAAVVGKEFTREAVAELLPGDMTADLSRNLMELVRKELLRPDRSGFGGDAFSFRHILIRDAAYASMSKEARASMHERFAHWVLETAGDRKSEYEEIVAHHFEQAYLLNLGLGPADDRVRSLAAAAIDALLRVASRARAREDVGATASVLERAVSMMDDEDPRLPVSLRRLAVVREATGAFAAARSDLERARQLAIARDDKREEGYSVLAAADVVLSDGVKDDPCESAEREAARWIPVFEEEGDDKGLAMAYMLRAQVSLVRCRWVETTQWAERSLHHQMRTDDVSAVRDVSHELTASYFFGPTPADEAIDRIKEMLADETLGPLLNMSARTTLAPLHAMRGEFEKARQIVQEARRFYEERGHQVWGAAMAFVAGPTEDYAGNPEGALAEYAAAAERLRAMGETGYRCTIVGMLALLLVRLKRFDEAETFALEGRDIAPPDDVSGQMTWRAAYANVLASRGQNEEALSLMTEAMELAESTDFVNEKAEMLLAQADVFEMTGDLSAATHVTERAMGLFEAKRNVAAVGRVRPLLDERRARLATEVAPS